MSANTPTVYLVDDDASFLRATARLLRATGFTVKTYVSAGEFLGALTDDDAGCALVDLMMPEMSGLELQSALAQRGQMLPVVFLTGDGDIPASVRAMRGGAEDFLEKRVPKEELLGAISRALQRDARLRSERERVCNLRARFDALTARELEVLGHVVRGQLNKQIAADLGIHERTVKLHRTAITTKLGVPSVAELTQLSHEAQIFAQRVQTFPKGQ